MMTVVLGKGLCGGLLVKRVTDGMSSYLVSDVTREHRRDIFLRRLWAESAFVLSFIFNIYIRTSLPRHTL